METNESNKKSEILGKLVVEETVVTKDLEKQIEEATKHFKIEKPTARILFQDFGSLSDKQRIAVILLGKFYATRLKIIDEPSLSISEIAKELGRPMTTLSWSMKELVKHGYVEYLPTRRYRIAYHRIKEIIDNVLNVKKKKG